ncbi:unnamed protein product, partial [marine sediment metagenome]
GKIKMQKNKNDWFAKYKTLKKKIIEKNAEISELKKKESQLKKEIGLEQLGGNK